MTTPLCTYGLDSEYFLLTTNCHIASTCFLGGLIYHQFGTNSSAFRHGGLCTRPCVVLVRLLALVSSLGTQVPFSFSLLRVGVTSHAL
jgi:hypothetical protein